MDFSKFDEQFDAEQMKKDIAEAKENGGGGFREVEKGTYVVKLETLELGTTKDGRPMLKGMFRIVEGEFKNSCLFYNRVLFGTKNDANMIASALGFLETLEPSEDVGQITFETYSQFANLVLDIAEDVSDELEYEIKYDPDAFQSISISEVFDVE